MQVCVINLEASLQRRRHIARQLDPLDIRYEFFKAIEAPDGLNFFSAYDEREYRINTGRSVSPGEAACYASHLCLWHRCVTIKEPMLILEDDAQIENYFSAALQFADRRIDAYGFFRLQEDGTNRADTKVPIERTQRFAVHYYTGYHYGAMAYALTPAVASRFIAASRVLTAPVDLFIKRFWVHGQALYGLWPSVVSSSRHCLQSTISLRDRPAPGFALRLQRSARKLRDRLARSTFNRAQLQSVDSTAALPSITAAPRG